MRTFSAYFKCKESGGFLNKNEIVYVYSQGRDLDDMLSNLEVELQDSSGEPIAVEVTLNDLDYPVQQSIVQKITEYLMGA